MSLYSMANFNNSDYLVKEEYSCIIRCTGTTSKTRDIALLVLSLLMQKRNSCHFFRFIFTSLADHLARCTIAIRHYHAVECISGHNPLVV